MSLGQNNHQISITYTILAISIISRLTLIVVNLVMRLVAHKDRL